MSDNASREILKRLQESRKITVKKVRESEDPQEKRRAIFHRRQEYEKYIDGTLSDLDGQEMYFYGAIPSSDEVTEAFFTDGSEINVYGDEIELLQNESRKVGSGTRRLKEAVEDPYFVVAMVTTDPESGPRASDYSELFAFQAPNEREAEDMLDRSGLQDRYTEPERDMEPNDILDYSDMYRARNRSRRVAPEVFVQETTKEHVEQEGLMVLTGDPEDWERQERQYWDDAMSQEPNYDEYNESKTPRGKSIREGDESGYKITGAQKYIDMLNDVNMKTYGSRLASIDKEVSALLREYDNVKNLYNKKKRGLPSNYLKMAGERLSSASKSAESLKRKYDEFLSEIDSFAEDIKGSAPDKQDNYIIGRIFKLISPTPDYFKSLKSDIKRVEEIISESLSESRTLKGKRVREDLSLTIPDWVRQAIIKYRLGKDMGKKLDLYRLWYREDDVPTSNRDKRLSDPNRLNFYRLQGEDGRYGVYIPGYFTNDSIYFNGNRRMISDMSYRDILSVTVEFGYIDLTKPANSPMEVRKSRVERKEGSDVDRMKNRQQRYDSEYTGTSYYQKSGYDKSGYKITGAQKYIDMLNDVNMETYGQRLAVVEKSINDVIARYNDARSLYAERRKDLERNHRNFIADKLSSAGSLIETLRGDYDRFLNMIDEMIQDFDDEPGMTDATKNRRIKSRFEYGVPNNKSWGRIKSLIDEAIEAMQ